MAGTKEIKNRISSVRDTKKITNAMYLISSTKLKRARKSMEDIEPFFYGLQNLIMRMMRHFPDIEHPFLRKESDERKDGKEKVHGFLVITADKGLAGSYNQNVLRAAVLAAGEEASRFFVVGEVGRRYLEQMKKPIEEHFQYTAQNPTRARARQITATFLKEYRSGDIDDLSVVFTAMKNSLESETRIMKLLPLEVTLPKENIPSDVVKQDFLMHPSPAEVIDEMVPSYISGLVYSALVESYCAEQNCRMQAMSAANDSADEIMQDLRIKYNKERQGAITQEITEVSAGASVLGSSY